MVAADIRILIVDDEPFALKVLKRMLARLGLTSVMGCSSVRLAMDYLDDPAHPVDLIMLDLNMPEMDGIEFVRELVRRRYRGSLILMSGEDEHVLQTAVLLARSHHLNTLGHLHKPVKPAQLAAMIARWVPPASRSHEAVRRTYGADEIRAAIANGELTSVYQPQVDVHSGAVVGVESLVRWRHPRDGTVYPDQFINVAEAHGFVSDLTAAMLPVVLSQARQWHAAGLELRVAINLSAASLVSLDLPDVLEHEAAAAGVAPRDIVLEVTESRLITHLSAALDVLTRLRLKRFRLSIDDFGTGHSSLSQLRDIPFDELKIDRGFVYGAQGNEKKQAIFRASRDLARRLGMLLVAEGVEDPDDWDFVRREGCDAAQGYFVSRPMPADELTQWMVTWQHRVRDGFESGGRPFHGD